MNIKDFEPDINKRCTTCKDWKELTAFSPHSTSYDGLHPQCKSCRNKSYRRKYRRAELKKKELEINEIVMAKPKPPRKQYKGPVAKAWAGPITISECKTYTPEEIAEMNK